MAVSNFEDLLKHRGHRVEVAAYSKDFIVHNIAIECNDCSEILTDFDNPKTGQNKDPMLMNNEEFREFIKDMHPDYADTWIVMRFESIVYRLTKKFTPLTK